MDGVERTLHVIHFAALWGQHMVLRELLARFPAGASARDGDSRTPLMHASMGPCHPDEYEITYRAEGRAACIHLLLAYGADPCPVFVEHEHWLRHKPPATAQDMASCRAVRDAFDDHAAIARVIASLSV